MNSIETAVLRTIGENVSSPDVFTDDATGLALIRGSINDAIQELCAVTGSYTAIYHLHLLENRTFYRMEPTANYFGYILDCWDRAHKKKLERTTIAELNERDPWWMTSTGDPEGYIPIGQKYIAIYRKPSASGITLELKSVMIPLSYSDDGEPIKVKSAFQRAITYYACGEFYASRGDAIRASEYHQKYLETSGLMGLNPQQAERQWQYGSRYNPRTN